VFVRIVGLRRGWGLVGGLWSAGAVQAKSAGSFAYCVNGLREDCRHVERERCGLM
jgi:hypothetical protein